MSTKALTARQSRLAATAPRARFELANRVFFRLYQSSNMMHRTGTRAVAGHGATTQQWAVMGALSRPVSRRSGMSVKELMLFLAVSRQSLTVALNRLEDLNLVERVREKVDGRIRRIRLTKRGQRTWQKMLINIDAYYKSALADFSDRDLQQLFTLLDRLTNKLTTL